MRELLSRVIDPKIKGNTTSTAFTLFITPGVLSTTPRQVVGGNAVGLLIGTAFAGFLASAVGESMVDTAA